jgi:hypothetical protein
MLHTVPYHNIILCCIYIIYSTVGWVKHGPWPRQQAPTPHRHPSINDGHDRPPTAATACFACSQNTPQLPEPPPTAMGEWAAIYREVRATEEGRPAHPSDGWAAAMSGAARARPRVSH